MPQHKIYFVQSKIIYVLFLIGVLYQPRKIPKFGAANVFVAVSSNISVFLYEHFTFRNFRT